MTVFYGFIAGMAIGLIAAAIIATLVMPAGVLYEHLTLGDRQFDCIAWGDHIVCDEKVPAVSLQESEAK